MEDVFEASGLPWKVSGYHRTTHHLQSSHPLVPSFSPPLVQSYSIKSVFLNNVSDDEALYRPGEQSRTQSMVFPSAPVEQKETPMAMGRAGEGWLGGSGMSIRRKERGGLCWDCWGLIRRRWRFWDTNGNSVAWKGPFRCFAKSLSRRRRFREERTTTLCSRAGKQVTNPFFHSAPFSAQPSQDPLFPLLLLNAHRSLFALSSHTSPNTHAYQSPTCVKTE